MNWVKENWFKVGGILLCCFALYWFGIRPGMIKKECAWTTYEETIPAILAVAAIPETTPEPNCISRKGHICPYVYPTSTARAEVPAHTNQVTRQRTKSEFDFCLKEHGL